MDEWMGEWREEFILRRREKWEPPPPLKPVSPSIAICSLTQLGAKMTVKFSALRVFSELHFQGPHGGSPSLFSAPTLHFHPHTLLWLTLAHTTRWFSNRLSQGSKVTVSPGMGLTGSRNVGADIWKLDCIPWAMAVELESKASLSSSFQSQGSSFLSEPSAPHGIMLPDPAIYDPLSLPGTAGWG